MVARHRRDGESAAIVYIDLVNHGRIRDAFGTAAAEQSLLRSVIKLRRLLRDVDTVSRVGEARFGVILEGASSRASVTERAARLIAAGLMPLPGLKPDVTLQFHIAALLLNERALEADDVQAACRRNWRACRRALAGRSVHSPEPAGVRPAGRLVDVRAGHRPRQRSGHRRAPPAGPHRSGLIEAVATRGRLADRSVRSRPRSVTFMPKATPPLRRSLRR